MQTCEELSSLKKRLAVHHHPARTVNVGVFQLVPHNMFNQLAQLNPAIRQQKNISTNYLKNVAALILLQNEAPLCAATMFLETFNAKNQQKKHGLTSFTFGGSATP